MHMVLTVTVSYRQMTLYTSSLISSVIISQYFKHKWETCVLAPIPLQFPGVGKGERRWEREEIWMSSELKRTVSTNSRQINISIDYSDINQS